MVQVEIKGDKIYIGSEAFRVPANSVIYFSEGIGYITFYVKGLEDVEKLEKLVKDKEFLELYYELSYKIPRSWEDIARYVRNNLDILVKDKKALEKLKKNMRIRLKLSYSFKEKNKHLKEYIINTLMKIENKDIDIFDFVEIKEYLFDEKTIIAIKKIGNNIVIISIDSNKELTNLKDVKIYLIDYKNNIYRFDSNKSDAPKSIWYDRLGKTLELLEKKKYLELLRYITTKFEKMDDMEHATDTILDMLRNIDNDIVNEIRVRLGAYLI